MKKLFCLLGLIGTFAFSVQAQKTRGIIPVAFTAARPSNGKSTTIRRSRYRRTSLQTITAAKPDELSQL